MRQLRFAPPLAVLLCAALAAPSAAGQVLSSQSWVQGAAGSNFGLAFTDLDVEAGALSAWCDYQGLLGDLVAVEVRTPHGAVLGTVGFDGLRAGFASGVVQLAGAPLDAAVAEGYELHLCTTAFPLGEMAGLFHFPDPVIELRILDSAQVVGSIGATAASAMLHLTRYASGRVILSGQTSGLDLPCTGLELRGPAWFGENGPLVLDLAPFDTSNLPSTFFVDLPAGTLSADELRDLDEGFQYLLLRTAAFPDGALRAQTELEWFAGDHFCRGRPNSTSQIGAELFVDGSPRISDRALTLRGESFPDGSLVLALAGRGRGHVFHPGASQGILCLGGASIARLGVATAAGDPFAGFLMPIDLTQLPVEAGLAAGESLHFQCWYRDVQGGVPVSNFSSAVRIRPR
ncbi:MAG: CHRD domain-containing protein [Planctomycetota bacterium]